MKRIFCAIGFFFVCIWVFANPCDGWTMGDGRSAASYFYEVRKECDIPSTGTLTYYFYDTYTNDNGDGEVLLEIILDWFIAEDSLGWTSSYTDPAAEASVFWDRTKSRASTRFDDNQNLARSVRDTLVSTDSDICITVVVDKANNTALLYINNWDKLNRRYTTFVYRGW
jgi:hypothetical protein